MDLRDPSNRQVAVLLWILSPETTPFIGGPRLVGAAICYLIGSMIWQFAKHRWIEPKEPHESD